MTFRVPKRNSRQSQWTIRIFEEQDENNVNHRSSADYDPCLPEGPKTTHANEERHFHSLAGRPLPGHMAPVPSPILWMSANPSMNASKPKWPRRLLHHLFKIIARPLFDATPVLSRTQMNLAKLVYDPITAALALSLACRTASHSLNLRKDQLCKRALVHGLHRCSYIKAVFLFDAEIDSHSFFFTIVSTAWALPTKSPSLATTAGPRLESSRIWQRIPFIRLSVFSPGTARM